MKRLTAALIPFIAALAFASPSHAYLHADWACVHQVTTGDHVYTKADIQYGRSLGKFAQGQALILTADNYASAWWNGWPGYKNGGTSWVYSGGSSQPGNVWRYARNGNEDITCWVEHHNVFDYGVIAQVRVKGMDDTTNGIIYSMRVEGEWQISPTRQLISSKATNWDPCTGDPACNH